MNSKTSLSVNKFEPFEPQLSKTQLSQWLDILKSEVQISIAPQPNSLHTYCRKYHKNHSTVSNTVGSIAFRLLNKALH